MTVGAILTQAMPSVMEQVISVAIGLTDTIVAGHTGNTDAYRAASAAAVGTMTYLQWFAGLMTAALGTGASAIVARSIGAKDPDTANKTAGTVCSAAFLIGIAVAAFLFLCGAAAGLDIWTDRRRRESRRAIPADHVLDGLLSDGWADRDGLSARGGRYDAADAGHLGNFDR